MPGYPIDLGTNLTYLTLIPLSGYELQLTPYSARGLTQTLEPITGVNGSGDALGTWLRRDLNGNLINLSDIRLRKYISDVSCRDTETPCLDDAWIGITCQVDCACELSFPTGGTPQRSVVSGSERTEGSFTFYRPSLTMMVSAIKNRFEEYAATYSWQIRLVEI